MPARTLLYLTTAGMVAYRWRAGELIEDASFAPRAAGGKFADYLCERHADIFSLLANTADEAFQVDTIPFLRGSDREAVIDRRLRQFFHASDLTTSVSLGYEKSRRKNERLLFASLTDKALFAPWLDAIESAEVKLEGIHSLPLVAGRLMERLHAPRERVLLLTIHGASVRQTFFSGGHVQFSRMSSLPDGGIAALAQTVASEAGKAQQYLAGQRLIARQEPLTVRVIAHPEAIPALEAACTDSDTLAYDFSSIIDVARRCGLKSAPVDSRADLVLLDTLARLPPRQQFARAPLRRAYRLWQVDKAIRAAAGVVLAACALFTATNALDIRELGRQIDEHNAASARADQRYRELAASFPPLPVGNDALRAITTRYQAHTRLSRGPAPLYAEVSRALGSAPQIEIDAIEWKINDEQPSGMNETTESASIRGSIRLAPNADARDVLHAFERFILALKSNPLLAVTVRQQPFDTGSEKTLKSSNSAPDPGSAKPFALSLSRRIES